MASYLEKSMSTAMDQADLIRKGVMTTVSSGNVGTITSGDQLYASPSFQNFYTFNGDLMAAEQYRRFNDWAYVCINAIAKRAARQKPMMAVKAAPVSSRGMNASRFTKEFNLSTYKMSGKKRFARPIKKSEVKALKANRHLSHMVKDALGKDTALVESHEFLDALANPNDLFTKWTLIYLTICSLEITGRCYWWVYENEETHKIEIWPIPVSWVHPINYPSVNFEFKVIPPMNPAAAAVIPGGQIAVFNLPDPSNPTMPLSPLQTQMKAVVVDDQIQTAQAKSMSNGLFPGVMLVAGRLPDQAGVPGERPVLTPDQRGDLISAIKGVYQGVQKFDEPFIVDGLIEDIRPYTNKPAEMAFLDSGMSVKSRIFSAFGVNPIIVGEIAGANRAQAAVAEDNFVSNAVNPILDLISEAITGWIGQSEHLAGFGAAANVIIWIAPAESHDADLELSRWTLGTTIGAVSKNEYRQMILKLQPVPGAENDALPNVNPSPADVMGKETERRNIVGKSDGDTIELNNQKTSSLYHNKANFALNPVANNRFGRVDSQLTADNVTKSFASSLMIAESSTANEIHGVLKDCGKETVAKFKRMAERWEPRGDVKSFADHMAAAIVDNSEYAEEIMRVTRSRMYDCAAKSGIMQASMIQSSIRKILTKASSRESRVVFTDQMSEELIESIHDSIQKAMSQSYWQRIPRQIRKLVSKNIEDGLNEGLNYNSIAKNIMASLDGEGGMNRARIIASTECASAMNCGNYESIMVMHRDGLKDGQSFITGIKWRNMRDLKVRCSHQPMNNVIVPTGDLFMLPPPSSKKLTAPKKSPKTHLLSGYERAPYPAYYGLSAGNRIRCRCCVTAEVG